MDVNTTGKGHVTEVISDIPSKESWCGSIYAIQFQEYVSARLGAFTWANADDQIRSESAGRPRDDGTRT